MSLPVTAILDLWSLGHSARDISDLLDVRHRRVLLIIEQARDIGDPRAVQHIGHNGRPLGRPTVADVEFVPAIYKRWCRHGHIRSPENVADNGDCRTCKNLRDRARRKCRRIIRENDRRNALT